NKIIHGDNLLALKSLLPLYEGKVKCIYIDPPYNTGNDFIYNDTFRMDTDDYEDGTGYTGDYDERMYKNTDTNGKFHSDWCSMIYSRLLLARTLLSEDGVIFISIDDNEQENLKKICDEIFGASNFIAQITWERAYAPINLKKHFSESHDYILCYAKMIDNVICNGLPKTLDALDRYKNPDNDIRGVWKATDSTVGPVVNEKVYPLVLPSGRTVYPSSGRCWLYSKEKFEELIKDNRVWFGSDGNSVPSIKKFASEVKQTMTPMTIWKYTEVGHSQDATKKLKELFDNQAFFTYPKPIELIKRCIQLYSHQDSIVMDFFSGSGTTAHAVMQLNAEDGGKRKFIMVQLPEKTDTKSEAYKAGYKNICEIGKERIRRAGKKIKEENPLLVQELDTGFRVFRVDSTNMEDIYYSPFEISQNLLFESNIKPDRNDLDLLFGCVLDWGLTLDMPYKCELIDGHKVYTYADGSLMACFEENITERMIDEIISREPMRVLFRDSCFKNDCDKLSVVERFKLLAPEIEFKVI
ncbi:MAG: site-specific DNA-methyltransferase, partial [Clostridia bacterium]|nr:site-specific DNA-methyltransferase [Clostridia bacterium]